MSCCCRLLPQARGLAAVVDSVADVAVVAEAMVVAAVVDTATKQPEA
jgi:hypothetical protein